MREPLSIVELQGASVRLGARPVLERQSLTLERGGVTAVLGPSGCGKTTLLRLIAGLLDPTVGRIERRAERIRIAFQDSCLLPWRTAIENVEIGMLSNTPNASLRRKQATELLERCGVDETAQPSYPSALSGGMASRVAFSRALAAKPDLLLCDEPFAALDDARRRDMQDLLLERAVETGMTTVFVTHHEAEAQRIADRILRFQPQSLSFA